MRVMTGEAQVLFDFFEPFGLEKRNCELDLAHVGFDLAYLAFQLIEAIAHFEPHFAEQYLEQYKGEIFGFVIGHHSNPIV